MADDAADRGGADDKVIIVEVRLVVIVLCLFCSFGRGVGAYAVGRE